MALSWYPPAPWWLVAMALAAAGCVLLAVWIWRYQSRPLGRLPPGHAILAVLQLAILAILVAAVCDPVLEVEKQEGDHLAVVIDVSESVQRAARDWPAARGLIRQRLRQALAEVPAAVMRGATASVILAGRRAAVRHRQLPLVELAGAVSRLEERDLPAAGGSDVGAGLAAAAELLAQRAGGAVLLISDGHQTAGDALAAARDLARRGITVHVLPLAGRAPALGIWAADLPPRVEAGSSTVARLFLANAGDQPTSVDLRFAVDRAPAADRSIDLPPARQVAVRQPLRFDTAGIHVLDVEMQTPRGAQRRRFFTQVMAPPRVLCVGRDLGWTRVLDGAGLAVTAASPGAALPEPGDFDAVVLDGVAHGALGSRFRDRLHAAVSGGTTGLLLVNGAHAGSDGQPTVLNSYHGNPLGELSPLLSRTRPADEPPPPRHAVIVLDASGSMAPWQLAKEKQIAAHLVDLLRPEDRLDLIAFTDGARHLMRDQWMDSDGKEQARRTLASIVASGATDPSAALELIAERRLRDCGLFFLSDGDFDRVALRPDCEATVFAIGGGSVSQALRRLAEPHPVGKDFDPGAIRFRFFHPEPRRQTWITGSYRPLGWPAGGEVPRLEGHAVARPRDDADVTLYRPRPRDPVLAYRPQGAATVGALTTALPDPRREAAAIRRWIGRLLAWEARDRYALQLRDRGAGTVALEIAASAGQGRSPDAGALSVELEVGSGFRQSVALEPDPDLPGIFRGTLRLPPVREPTPGALVLVESGAGSERPQRIPFLVPPAARTSPRSEEAWSFGLDRPLLEAIAGAGFGRLDPTGDDLLPPRRPGSRRGLELRSALLCTAAALYLLQIFARRFR